MIIVLTENQFNNVFLNNMQLRQISNIYGTHTLQN